MDETIDVNKIREAYSNIKRRQDKYMNKHPIKSSEFKEGDSIKLKVDFVDLSKEKKLTETFKGPYVIIRKIKENVYKLLDPFTNRNSTKNIDKLAKFNGPKPTNYRLITMT